MTSRDFRARDRRVCGCVFLGPGSLSASWATRAPATWPRRQSWLGRRSRARCFGTTLYPYCTLAHRVSRTSALCPRTRPRRTMNGNGHTRPRSKTPCPPVTRHHPRHPRGKSETPTNTGKKGSSATHAHARTHARHPPRRCIAFVVRGTCAEKGVRSPITLTSPTGGDVPRPARKARCTTRPYTLPRARGAPHPSAGFRCRASSQCCRSAAPGSSCRR